MSKAKSREGWKMKFTETIWLWKRKSVGGTGDYCCVMGIDLSSSAFVGPGV